MCTLVACSTPPPSSPAQRAADAAITARVQAALAAQPSLFAKDIVVSVQDGVVNLSGMAWSDDDIQTAGRVAGSVPGVKGVDNQVGLESAQVGR
jgi:hyperosmotically inducible protein